MTTATEAKERILIVDDEPSIRKYLQTLLEVEGHDVDAVTSGKSALELIGRGARPDLIILDVLMPEMDGLETLKQLMQMDPGLNVVMLSCSNEVSTVVEAIRMGAQDYLTKPFEKSELDAAILKCRKKRELRAENTALREYVENLTEDLTFLAASPQMVKIRQQVLQIAPVDVPVFIYGESGVGKEVVARMIHLRSARSAQPFVKVNCAALPSELLESELFGYVRGAFTGAVQSYLGKISAAQGGMLLLDEVGELPLGLQAKLLRFLEQKEVQRLGSSETVRVDVRVVAATNADLEQRLERGEFREDLYYRLSAFPLELPTLAKRREDILSLAEHFLKALAASDGVASRLTPQAIRLLELHTWPGNVRELQQVMERALILADGGSWIEAEHICFGPRFASLRQELCAEPMAEAKPC